MTQSSSPRRTSASSRAAHRKRGRNASGANPAHATGQNPEIPGGGGTPGKVGSSEANGDATEPKPRRAFTIFVAVLCAIMLGCMAMLWYYR